MTAYSHETAPTQFVEADGIRLAYRRFGQSGSVPIVFLQYFTGNLDHWDPAVTDGLASDREVILFDNAGVGSSSGKTPASVTAMTRDFVEFLIALGLKEIDVVGFSLGGMIAQELAISNPKLLRRIILLSTGPRGGEGMSFTELSAGELKDEDGLLLSSFFAPTDTSQLAGKEFLRRIRKRTIDRDQPISTKSAQAQLNAIREWGQIPSSDRYATLKYIKQKTLVVHGKADKVVLPINSVILAQQIPDAQLIVYPDSAHGAHYQYADLFLKHAKLFLDY